MGNLKNEFAYSGSKIGTFNKCMWQYYLRYYHKWDGWNELKGNDKYEAWKLTRIYPKSAWVGVHVHNWITVYLKWHFRKGVIRSKFLDYIQTEFDNAWEISKGGIYGEEKGIVLWEHHFEKEINKEEIWNDILKLFDNFFNTVPGYLKNVKYEDVLTIDVDDFSQWFHVSGKNGEQVKVYSIVDFAYQSEEFNKIYIWDWKTGKYESDYSKQLVSYAMYFIEEYSENPLGFEHFSLSEFNLSNGLFSNTKLTENSFDDLHKEIRINIIKLQELLIDEDIEKNEINLDLIKKNPENIAVCNDCIFQEICDIPF